MQGFFNNIQAELCPIYSVFISYFVRYYKVIVQYSIFVVLSKSGKTETTFKKEYTKILQA